MKQFKVLVPAFVVCALFLSLGYWGLAEEAVEDSVDRDYSAELPRIPALEPEEAMAAFELLPGYRIELVAAEPLVRDPVAMDFDEDGRLYVVEMRGYSEERQANISTVRLLTDENGDGRFDHATTFLDELPWPVAIHCYDGGVFVGSPPEILYCKDTTGDGVADQVEEVFTGFSLTNVQGLVNSFRWSHDNRIYGATSVSGAELVPGDEPGARPLTLRGRDFSFDPRTLEVRPESGGGQHGMYFDAAGRRYATHNSDHLQLYMFDDRYIARNPFLQAPNPRISIAADGPAADVYRISPVEPWRILRTRLRVQGIVPGPIEGGGRPAGYFTGATGVTIYLGNAMPELRDLAFVADVGGNLVHRKEIQKDGIELVGVRMDEQKEFLASTDIWFRPVQFSNAPDGAFYILDMYREVIEHPDSLPPVIKQHLDLNSGNDRGRIYRVVHEDFEQPPLPRLSEAGTEELVALLDHANGWHRRTAARLLYERQDAAAAPHLARVAREGAEPEGRARALYSLHSLEALEPEQVLVALGDEDASVRRHALILAEPFFDAHAELLARAAGMVEDTDPEVRYQLAFSLGEAASGEVRNEALATLARRHGESRWVRNALLSSLTVGADEVLALLVGHAPYRQSENGAAFIEALARQAGAAGESLELLLAEIDGLPEEEAALAQNAVRGLLEGLKESGQGGAIHETLARSERAAPLLVDMLEAARVRALDAEADAAARVDAIRTLAFDSNESAAALLPPLLEQQHPNQVQAAAIQTLSRFNMPEVAPELIARYQDLSPEMRLRAVEALFARREWIEAMLDAVAEERFSPAHLESTRIQSLLTHPDAELRARAETLLADYQPGRRQDVVEAYMDVLELPGDPERGRAIFAENCSQCHQLEGVGFAVGPDLANVGNSGAEFILVNILDPNREVSPEYVNYIIETRDWESYSGIIDAETATSITLKRAMGATDTLLRVNIEEIRSGELSIMPEGWEETLGRQGLADILTYLQTMTEE